MKFVRHVFLAALFASTAVRAEFWSGNKLLAEMQGDAPSRMLALGYVMGVHDAHEHVNHCSPSTVNAGQVRDVVLRFLEQAPEVRHRTADVIIREILRATWPCAGGTSRPRGSAL
jgi:hypothetical protein